MKNTWSYNINNGIDDYVRNMQALALLLANTSTVIDFVVEKINSQLQLNIKDHQTVVALSIIRSDKQSLQNHRHLIFFDVQRYLLPALLAAHEVASPHPLEENKQRA